MQRYLSSHEISGGAGSAPSCTPDQLRFERLLSDLSVNFIDLPTPQIDLALEDSLIRIVDALGIDRSTLHRVYPLTGRVELVRSVAIEGVEPVPRTLSAREMSPWTFAMATANKPVVFNRLDDLPPEAGIDKETFRRIGLRSHVTMPITVAGELYGGLSFGCVRKERNWSDDLLSRMRRLAEVFGSALARKQAQDELERAFGFEKLATRVMASLALVQPGEERMAVQLGLRQIGEFMGAEQIVLWHRAADARLAPMQSWNAEGFALAIDRMNTTNSPWAMAQVAAGCVVRVTRLDDLGAQAATDRAFLQEIGVRSLLFVPISGPGDAVGAALSMASMRLPTHWPDASLYGVRLLADVFDALHARAAGNDLREPAAAGAARWHERLAHLVRIHTADAMSATLAHEIGQPLGAIENYAIAAQRRLGDASPDLRRVGRLLDKVLGQATRAGDVVTRMRSAPRPRDVAPEPVDVERAITKCAGLMTTDCQCREVRIEVTAAVPLPMGLIDEVCLEQVVLDLLRNAMEAIERANADVSREIVVGIGLGNEGDILVEISDRGVGIAEGDLERIFEPFYSARSSGFGVGLAICRKLIEAHGGALWASHNPGGGTSLRFTMPVAKLQ